jgi:hypothetical protein
MLPTFQSGCRHNSYFCRLTTLVICRACLIPSVPTYLPTRIGGHRHRPQYRRYPTSDIDIYYSDIGRKYVGLKTVIPISEGFLYRHLSPFRYPISKKKIITPAGFELKTLVFSATVLIYEFLAVGYRIKVYSDIRYNVGFRSLQSDIGSSDIKLSPISLITDIGVSAHLCLLEAYFPAVTWSASMWHQPSLWQRWFFLKFHIRLSAVGGLPLSDNANAILALSPTQLMQKLSWKPVRKYGTTQKDWNRFSHKI